MPEHTVKTPTRARSGSKEGVVRYILAISTLLAVVLLAASYLMR